MITQGTITIMIMEAAGVFRVVVLRILSIQAVQVLTLALRMIQDHQTQAPVAQTTNTQ